MSLTGKGWREGAVDFLSGIQDVDALATAFQNGTIDAAQFLRIAAAVLQTRAINTTLPLAGGGDLSADRTFVINAATSLAAGSMSAADFAKLAAIASNWTLTRSAVIDFTAAGTTVAVPKVTGKSLNPMTGLTLVITAATGAMVTQPAGTSNGNWLAQGTFTMVTSGQFANAVGHTPGRIAFSPNQLTSGANALLFDTDASITIATPAAGTGGFSLQGYFICPVSYE